MTRASDDFDPYHKWLGIPKDKRPPTNYQLLGISPSEQDEEAIEAAAERQSSFVRQFRNTEYDEQAALILFEIEDARFTLLDKEARRKYDATLHLKHRRQRGQKSTSPPTSKGRNVGEESGIVPTFIGVMAVLLVGFGLMAWFSFRLPWSKPDEVAHVDQAPVEERPVPPQRPEAPEDNPPKQIQETNPSEAAKPIEPTVDTSPTVETITKESPSRDQNVFISLFDGHSLKGWRLYDGGEINGGWIVEDGMLCRKGRGGYIITEQQFGNFELEFEWRMANGNSGVLYRVRSDDPGPFQSGPEYQMIGEPDAFQGSFTTSGSLYGLMEAELDAKNPPNEFNHSRIVVQGNHIEHWLNGKRVIEVEMHSPTWNRLVANSKFSKWRQFAKSNKGHISLQDAGADVCFRNIRIRELVDDSTQAAEGNE